MEQTKQGESERCHVKHPVTFKPYEYTTGFLEPISEGNMYQRNPVKDVPDRGELGEAPGRWSNSQLVVLSSADAPSRGLDTWEVKFPGA